MKKILIYERMTKKEVIKEALVIYAYRQSMCNHIQLHDRRNTETQRTNSALSKALLKPKFMAAYLDVGKSFKYTAFAGDIYRLFWCSEHLAGERIYRRKLDINKFQILQSIIHCNSLRSFGEFIAYVYHEK